MLEFFKHGQIIVRPQGDSPVPVDTWICSPLHVDAVTHDEQKDNFGRLLQFKTTLKEWCEWAMPMEMLKGYGEELRGALLALLAGFAGPLLHLTHSESGGVHFTGDRSTGKSASVEAACSIWGSPKYKRSWSTTASGNPEFIEWIANKTEDSLF